MANLEINPIVESLKAAADYEWSRYSLMERPSPESYAQLQRYRAASNAHVYAAEYAKMFPTPPGTCDLAAKWNAEAARHEHAAEETADEERIIHLEVASVLRSCARDLLA